MSKTITTAILVLALLASVTAHAYIIHGKHARLVSCDMVIQQSVANPATPAHMKYTANTGRFTSVLNTANPDYFLIQPQSQRFGWQ